jgi:hypothetical protein
MGYWRAFFSGNKIVPEIAPIGRRNAAVEFSSRCSEVPIGHTMVSIKYGAGLVTTHLHCHSFRDSRSHHVSDCGPSEVMGNLSCESSFSTCTINAKDYLSELWSVRLGEEDE